MAKMNFKASIFFLGIIFFGGFPSIVFSAGGWLDFISSLHYYGDQPVDWCNGHKELIQLAACAAQIPGILAIDSKNVAAIKASALLSMTATDAKILVELFKHSDDCLAKHCVYNVPKTMLYALASYYDYIRLTGKLKEFDPTIPESKHIGRAKITQFFQLGLEVLLRVFACIDSVDREVAIHGQMAGYLTELADWVELWRLIDRFSVLSDQDATFDERFKQVKQSIANSLTGLSGDLVKGHTLIL